jgi:SsrA-binding protein
MGIKIICKNQRAGYDYFLEEKYECGIALLGTEVKSMRQGKGIINEAFVVIDSNGEAWLQNATIPHYDFGNINNHPETRKRKLLLKREEIQQIDKIPNFGSYEFIPRGDVIKRIENEKGELVYFSDGKCQRELIRGVWWEKCSPKRKSTRKKT